MTTPRIYVGTYAKYNAGNLSGEWLDIEDYSDKEEFYEACKALHADEEDPEFMFQDMEGIPEGMAGESYVNEDLFEWAAMDEDDRELLQVYRDEVDSSGTLEQARDSFAGKYSSPADYAQAYIEESGQTVPDWLSNYIDYEAMARDWGYGGTSYVDHDGETWVFRNI